MLHACELTHRNRCYHLARLHCIHPTPSYASAVQLLDRAVRLIQQSHSSLFELGIDLQEQIIHLKSEDIESLSSRTQALESAAKRALFAERVPKPVFFDTAFNYIDLPMDDLLVLAGKQSAPTTSVPAAAAQKVQEVVESVVPKAAETIKAATGNVAKSRMTREATPAVEESDEGKQGKPKGWLGGWFGRG